MCPPHETYFANARPAGRISTLVMAKPMNSGGSSAFWFKRDETPGWVTEIDVFEIGGKATGFEHKYNMHLHVFKTPKEDKRNRSRAARGRVRFSANSRCFRRNGWTENTDLSP